MPAKLLNAFSGENPDVQKQIGCMTGIFQMFDRYRLVTRSRRNVHIHHERLPLDQAHLNNRRHEAERNDHCPRFALEKNHSKSLHDNRRVSMESSRPSCSSSSCSSFSSLDCNISTQEESSSFDRMYLSERSSKESPRLRSSVRDTKTLRHEPRNESSVLSTHQPLGIREVVKDSIHRDARGLSVKSSTREEVRSHASKHTDSPRPLPQSKSRDGTYMIGIDGKSRMLLDLDESLRVLVKLKAAPKNYSQASERPRLSSEARDASSPRFSFDGRESSRLSVDSREACRPRTRFKDLPRLSLDSRESSPRSTNLELKLHSVMKGLDRTKTSKVSTASNLNPESPSHNRLPGVVAKLMGLEALPNLGSAACEPTANNSTEERLLRSPKSFLKDSSTSPLRNCHAVVKPNSSRRRTVSETAPWRHQDRGHAPQRASTMYQEVHMKRQTKSVYCGTEKSFKELRFQKTSMNAKRLSETKSGAKGSATSRAFESPIVIMKPPNSIIKSAVASAPSIQLEGLLGLRKLQTSNTANRSKGSEKGSRRAEELSSPKIRPPAQPGLSGLQQSVNGNGGNSAKSSTSLSPRLRQRKAEVESRARSLVPSSELNQPRRMSASRQLPEPVSPRGKLRLKPSNTRPSDEHLKGRAGEMMIEQQAVEILRTSDSIKSSTEQTDVETTSANQLKQKLQKPSLILNKVVSTKELATVVPDQPSPVSVLDASFYQDDLSPSSVKRKLNVFADDETHTSDDCLNPPSILSTETNHKGLENNENPVLKLGQLSKASNEPFTANSVALLCDTQNPDHQYVAEILVASGLLLKDFSPSPVCSTHIQLHPSGHPINPDLFLVLEQTKSGWSSKPEPAQVRAPQSTPDLEKLHRKLVFDVVNEILVQKLELMCPGPHPSFLRQTTKRRGQLSLRELCAEVEQIQAESCKSSSFHDHYNLISANDVLRRSEGWEDFTGKLPRVALEIEKLIFKDLIDDVVSSEAASDLQATKQSRQRSQLILK